MWVIFALRGRFCEDLDGVSAGRTGVGPLEDAGWDGGMGPDGPRRRALRYRECVRINGKHGRLGALRLSISSTVLVFVVIPLGVIAVVAALVMSGSDRSRRSRRYRPGRPYDFQPMWFLAAPERVAPAAAGGGAATRAIEGPALEDISGARVLPGSVGGASDSW